MTVAVGLGCVALGVIDGVLVTGGFVGVIGSVAVAWTDSGVAIVDDGVGLGMLIAVGEAEAIWLGDFSPTTHPTSKQNISKPLNLNPIFKPYPD